MLMIAATVSIVLGLAVPSERESGGWVDGVAIWVAVFIVSIVGTTNDYQKELQVCARHAITPPSPFRRPIFPCLVTGPK